MKSKMIQEESNIDGNANNTNNKGSNYELVKRTDIPDSPFQVITTPEGSFLSMGKYRLTETMSEEEAINEGKNMTWNRIVQVVMLLWKQVNEEPETKNQ